jgi:hypothetical protein
MRTVRQKDAAPFGIMIASVVWSQFEQHGAIHNLPFAIEANRFKSPNAGLPVNSPPFGKHLQRLIDMAKDNASTTPGATASATALSSTANPQWRAAHRHCAAICSAMRSSAGRRASCHMIPT